MPEIDIKSNSRQIPKVKEICANKKYFDILYSYLQSISKYNQKENIRYFAKKDINFSKLGEQFNMSRQTMSNKFKNLQELGLICDLDAENYKLITLEKDIAALIPYDTVKLLTDTLSQNTISTYIYLFNRYFAEGYNSFQFTLDQVKAFIGISIKTRSNNDIITNILYVLEKIGLIRYSLTTLQQDEDSFQNVKTIYQLDQLTLTLKKEC